MVEMTGIEPVSKNPLTQLSPWAVILLDFPAQGAEGQAHGASSPFVLDRLKGEKPMQVHRLFDARPWGAVFPRGTGGTEGRGTAKTAALSGADD